jgi:DNA-binding transcriptional LysR family regulator
VKGALAAGELVAPFKRSADPARAYYAIVSKNAAGRPEVADFVIWLREEAKKESP